MSSSEYSLTYTPSFAEMLSRIPDARHRKKIADRIDELKREPSKQGAPLVENLAGYRDIRAVGQRYRVIYRVVEEAQTIELVAVGLRKAGDKKDIYALCERMWRRGELSP